MPFMHSYDSGNDPCYIKLILNAYSIIYPMGEYISGGRPVEFILCYGGVLHINVCRCTVHAHCKKRVVVLTIRCAQLPQLQHSYFCNTISQNASSDNDTPCDSTLSHRGNHNNCSTYILNTKTGYSN